MTNIHLSRKDDYRVRFSARLQAALEKAGHKASPTRLTCLFNEVFDGHPVTVHAARKWLVGEAVPTHEKLTVLAQLLQTTPQALAWGEDTVTEIVTRVPDDMRLIRQIRTLSDDDKRLVEDLMFVLSRRRKSGVRSVDSEDKRSE